MSIFAQHLLVLFKLFPRNVARMVAANQHRPLLTRLLVSRRLLGPTRYHFGPRLGFPKGVGARIQRIRQDCQNAAVAERFPVDLGSALAITNGQQRDLLLPTPEQNLSRSSELMEFQELLMNCIVP